MSAKEMTLIRARRLTWFALILALAGCASAPVIVYRPVKLPVPDAPMLVPVTAPEVSCLTDATYRNIVTREQLLRRWGQQLQAIIAVNNEAASHGK